MTLPPDPVIAQLAFEALRQVVAIDSQSDELSPSIPSTPGQVRLAGFLEDFYRTRVGAAVERDALANVIAILPGSGRGLGRAPVALMIHLDTARGTQAVASLGLLRAWDGGRISFSKNAGIQVDVATYPGLAAFVGHDLVHGPGDSPFGLDDKLGLAYCMTVAELLTQHPEIARPPLIFVARPDEEVGRHEAVVALAAELAGRGVRWAYTVDGIAPYEINLENFNAAMASITFAPRAPRAPAGEGFVASIGGVNTHGATAAAEGHRTALRLAAQWQAALDPADAALVSFVADARRDCDAVVGLVVADGAEARVRAALAAVMEPHAPRGASWSLVQAPLERLDGAVEEALRWTLRFLGSAPGFTLAAEESAGRDGYSQPVRATPTAEGLRVDVRLRDFEQAGLEARIAHVRAQAGERRCVVVDQYVNMGPRLAAHPGLAEAAERAARAAGVAGQRLPIRGGTGVDPFLEVGIPVANLGTGYFAPESEKELTSLQTMAGHVRWLLALVAVLAEQGPAAGEGGA
jgi:di/tripeptidase